MKRMMIYSVAILFVSLWMTSETFALQRGGRRGGGGGGRSAGPSRSMPSRSPSMSRPSPPSRPSTGTRPSTGPRPTPPSAGNRPGSRPNTGPRPNPGGNRPGASPRPGGQGPSKSQLNNFLDIPKPGSGNRPPQAGNRPAGGNAASDFLQNNRPSTGNPADRASNRQDNRATNRDNRSTNRTDRRDNLTDHRADRIDNMDQRVSDRSDRRDEARNQFLDNHPRYDFWKDNPNWARWRFNRPYRWATWAGISTWFAWGSSEPVYYSYGDNIYYQDDAVYYGDQEVASAEDYASQAQTIAESAPEVADDAEWMSLGVFAITEDGQDSGPPPKFYLQLAVNKQGVIAGTFQDMDREEGESVEGMIDPETQRTAWALVGTEWPIMETGLANLTEDTAPALIHFEDGETQQWLMVRMEEPEDGSQ